MRLPDDLWTSSYAYVVDGCGVEYRLVSRNADWTKFKDLKSGKALDAFREQSDARDKALGNLRRAERRGR